MPRPQPPICSSFPNVEDVLMVGIAGGIPLTTAPAEHVRLGDVVVSNKEGVIQYDNLKIESKEIKVRSNSNKPSARMIGAINLLESDRLMKKYPWEALVARAGEIEGAARPSDDSDKLFELTDDGEVCLIHPIDTTRRSGQPKIHYGRIGAANILLKNKMIRDHLRATHP